MSGGSFNYLCFEDAEDLPRKLSDMRDMAAALTSLGAHDAAGETEDMIAIVEHCHRRLKTRLYRLQQVWQAVEWRQSGDWGDDAVREALEKYRSGNDDAH